MSRLALILSLVSSVAAQCDFSNEFQAARDSLPSRVFCGRPPITEGQNEQAFLNRNISDEITGPVYEGSFDALDLGLSVENRIVDLTEAQINYYSRCGGETLLPTRNVTVTNGTERTGVRRKRQALINPCCNPSPLRALILVTVTADNRPAELIQTAAFQQTFEDTRFCPFSVNCNNVICGPVLTIVPADVLIVSSDPIEHGTTMVFVNICGAIPDPS